MMSWSKLCRNTPSEIVECFKFHSCVRRVGESIATFVSELRSLSEYCNFGGTLDNMIRDHLVCGVNDSAIQKCLLAESGLTYEKAVELALSAETAAQNVRELRAKPKGGLFSHSTPQEVHRTSTSNASPSQGPPKTSLTCYRCGR